MPINVTYRETQHHDQDQGGKVHAVQIRSRRSGRERACGSMVRLSTNCVPAAPDGSLVSQARNSTHSYPVSSTIGYLWGEPLWMPLAQDV